MNLCGSGQRSCLGKQRDSITERRFVPCPSLSQTALGQGNHSPKKTYGDEIAIFLKFSKNFSLATSVASMVHSITDVKPSTDHGIGSTNKQSQAGQRDAQGTEGKGTRAFI